MKRPLPEGADSANSVKPLGDHGLAETATADRSHYHHGDLRNALLLETRRALNEMPARDLSLRLIARRVGVSATAPSKHFSGLSDMLSEVAAQGYRELSAQRVKVLSAKHGTRRRLYLMMKAYVDFARANPGLFELMVGPRIANRELHHAIFEASHASFQMFADAVCDFARECGWPDTALPLLIHAAWSMEHGAARLINDDRVPGYQHTVNIDDMVDFSISSLISMVERGPADFPPRGG